MVRLIGKANITNLIVSNHECGDLIDLGAQVTTIMESFEKSLGLPIHYLSNILSVEGTGGINMNYKGYVEVQLSIPEVRAYNQAVLMLVINGNKFGDRVQV